jgi:hypothetical protein
MVKIDMNNIKFVNIIFNNGDDISLNADDFEEIYVANIDENGNEIEYEMTPINGTMNTNFVFLKLKKEKNGDFFNRIQENKDIIQVMFIFKNDKYVKFNVTSNSEPFANEYINEYQHFVQNERYYGCIVSEFPLKYRQNLFA